MATIATINGCVLISHPADWSTPPQCKRIWETEIAESLPGAEARNALRAVARRQVTFLITAKSLQERVRLESRMDAASKSGYCAAPLHGRCSFLSGAVNAGANSITVGAGQWSWQAGDYIILIADDQTFDVAAVTAVADGVLTLASNLNFSWANGALVWPLIFGKFSSEKETALDGHHASVKVTVAELVSGRSAQIGATPASVPGIGQMKISGTPAFKISG